ncbi:MAG: hypothetical protein JJT96_00530 [Opitutales bacterium]|nr:hypothetical protein [Opitutales bacterium]
MEDYLGRDDLVVQPGMVEQTLFCLMMGSGPTWQTTPEDVHCSYRQTTVSPSALAVHFIYSMKPHWRKYLSFQPANRVAKINLVKAKPLTYSAIAVRKARRLLRRRP